MNFVDYYELMQISANAQQDTISRVYKMLASRFHPDNPETGDTDHFLKLQKAHGVLSNAEQRAAYDDDWRLHYQRPLEVFGLKDFSEGIEGENNRRMGILCLLYNRRKAACEESSLSVLQMETLMAFPREHLMFTLWYLRQKKYIEFNFNSEYEITAEGIDLVESKFPKSTVMQKLIASPSGTKLTPRTVLDSFRPAQTAH